MSRATVLRAVARGLLRPAVVTPGGHRRFLVEDPADGAEDGLKISVGLDGPTRRAELVSSSEAARLLGVSQPTLNRAVRDGRVRPAAVTPGGHRRFAASELADSRAAALNAETPDWSGC